MEKRITESVIRSKLDKDFFKRFKKEFLTGDLDSLLKERNALKRKWGKEAKSLEEIMAKVEKSLILINEISRKEEVLPEPPKEETKETLALPQLEAFIRETEAIPTPDFHIKETTILPKEKPVIEEWTTREVLLYDDVHTLFNLGDTTGALISIERLLLLSPSSESLKKFIETNEETIFEQYRAQFGNFERIPVRSESITNAVPLPKRLGRQLEGILNLIDGYKNIEEIMKISKLSRIITLAYLNHLIRSGFVELY